jgi:hypothetical protein
MSPSLGWLIALATCYPWLLAGDLLSDLTAPWHLLVFISGAVLVTPFLYLRTWQAVLLAGCVGLAFEARRPIAPGTFALLLMIVSVVAVAWRERLNSKTCMAGGRNSQYVGMRPRTPIVTATNSDVDMEPMDLVLPARDTFCRSSCLHSTPPNYSLADPTSRALGDA